MKFENTPGFAKEQDQQDPLKRFRDQFHIPEKKGQQVIYFCGNSLGLQPKNVSEELTIELDSWRNLAVEGHFHGKRPWVDYHHYTKDALARLVGAKPLEVVSMNSLTTNIHLLLASFYQPTAKKNKIMIERGAFPSDHYAVESHMKRMGIDPGEHLVVLEPENGPVFTTSEITGKIRELKGELALVLLPGVQYYTGQFFDLKAITRAAHEAEAYVGFDLAHAIGNLPLFLHDNEVDFATWCSYKYLNSGPGGVSGIFVHERHCTIPDFPKLTGWWGHDNKSRFQMDNQFVPNPGVDAWMMSNVNIISTAVHLASLKIFDQTDMQALRKKSIDLTGYLEYLLTHNECLQRRIALITPAHPGERGCQLSMYIHEHGKDIFNGLMDRGVILDWREPNVIRVAPVPLYNTFEEVWEFCEILKKLMGKYEG